MGAENSRSCVSGGAITLASLDDSGARNGKQAIEFWLADYENPHTRGKCRTEAEQRPLCAIFAKGQPRPQ